MPRRRSGGKSSGRSYSTGSSGPRNRSSGPRSRSSPSPKKSSPKPAKAKDEPKKVETTYGGSNSGSLGSTIADGFLWGTGNAIAHIFVEGIFGPRTIKQEVVVPEKVNEVANVSGPRTTRQKIVEPEKVNEVANVSAKDDNVKLKDCYETCDISYNAFQDCLNVEGNNLSKCQLFMDSLFECKRNSSSFNS